MNFSATLVAVAPDQRGLPGFAAITILSSQAQVFPAALRSGGDLANGSSNQGGLSYLAAAAAVSNRKQGGATL